MTSTDLIHITSNLRIKELLENNFKITAEHASYYAKQKLKI